MKDKKQIERYKKAIDNEDWYTIEKIQKEIKKDTIKFLESKDGKNYLKLNIDNKT